LTKRADLLRAIGDAAGASGITFEFVRHGSRHDIWRVGSTQFSVPRHREIGDRLALAVRQSLEDELGEAWWR
jgi:mRNA interferase HicA